MPEPNVTFVFELRSARAQALVRRLRNSPLLPDNCPPLTDAEDQAVGNKLRQVLPGYFRFLDSRCRYFAGLLNYRKIPTTVFPLVEEYETVPQTFLAISFVRYLTQFDRLCCLLEQCRLAHVIEIGEYHLQIQSLEGSTFHAFERARKAVKYVLSASAAPSPAPTSEEPTHA